MSYASDKGYWAEHQTVLWLHAHEFDGIDRPRTTSYSDTDWTDVDGMPFVISVKNHRSMRLGEWTDELVRMVERSKHQTGLIVHKRHGKGQVDDWYGTAPMRLWLPFIRPYVDARDDGRVT